MTSTREPSFTDEADVIVVGFGGAGACAALQASSEGASVLVLDRFHGGGATRISGGVYYGGGGTRIQREAGVDDSVEAMFGYLQQEVKGVVSDELLRDFCESSAKNLEWLEAHGVPFDPSLCPFKTSYPLDKYFLYYSGNESFAPYRDAAKPAPRGHRAKGKGLPGQNFYEPLRRSVHHAGVDVRYEARVEKLLTDEDGRVIGVEYEKIVSPFWIRMHRLMQSLAIKVNHYSPGTARRLRARAKRIERRHSVTMRARARGGVILAAGGFIHNREMVAKHAPGYRPGVPLGTMSDDGKGIALGEDVGGATDLMHRVSAWRFINPPVAFTRGILVNAQGERYINEQMYGAAIGEAMVEHQGGVALLVIDQALWNEARSQVGPGKAQWFQSAPALLNLYANARKGETVADAARRAKLPEEKLRATVDAYNKAIDEGAADPFGKSDENRKKLVEAPFYVIDCGIASKRFPCPTLTLGGLVVDERSGGVKRADGSRVEGLYAAGRNAVGICSRQYVSGLSIADCVYSGRRAGRAAAGAALGREETDAQPAPDALAS